MNTYSQNKFSELTLSRKIRVMLDLVYKIEESWEQEEQRVRHLNLFKDYFSWTDFYEQEAPLLKHLANYQFNINGEMNLRTLLDVAVPMERFLDLAIKDEHILRVREGDQLEKQRKTFPLYFVLDHLRSAFNVGSLFRTAECLGVEHIYLVGYTPTPEDQGVQKTAMGTSSKVSWSCHNHLDEVFELLKDKKIPVVALETVEGSLSLEEFKAPDSLAFLVGNERFGLSQGLLEKVNQCVEIPMYGTKNSLNVANSLSIATFEVIRQWQK